MDRRRFLAVALAGALAGCGDGTETVADESTATPGGTPTETPADTQTGSPTADAKVEFTEHELVVEEGGESGDGSDEALAYVSATAENVGEAASGRIELTITWFGEGDEQLDESTGTLRTLRPGETWLARVEPETNQEDVTDYELDGEFEVEPPGAPEGVDVAESDLTVDRADVTVTGTVENGSGEAVEYLEAIARLFDGRGRVLDDQWTNQSDVADGDAWEFTVELPEFARAGEIAEHEVVLNEDVG